MGSGDIELTLPVLPQTFRNDQSTTREIFPVHVHPYHFKIDHPRRVTIFKRDTLTA